MADFRNLFPKNLYHSYIIESNESNVVLKLREFLEERGDIEANSPDVLCQTYDAFSISDSSIIKDWHSESSTSRKRICIIETKFINHEAERTLLKIIEEPAINTHFFIIVPNASVLLDTIRSRAHIIKIFNFDNEISEKNAIKFISLKPSERIDFISQIIKDNKDNDDSGALRYIGIELINGIEKNIYQKFLLNRNDKKNQFILEELRNGRDFLSLPGCSPKMILEHISLML